MGNMTIEEARSLVLQKIGRNLVNLQKLESMLKQLLATNHLDGAPSEIPEKVARRVATVSRMTLGQVIQELETMLFDDRTTTQGQLYLSAQPWLSSKMTIEGGPEAAKRWKSEMSAILKERNELVHHMLVTLDPNSIEGCQTLGDALDSQMERLLPVYQHVQSLAIAQKEALQDFSKKLERPD